MRDGAFVAPGNQGPIVGRWSFLTSATALSLGAERQAALQTAASDHRQVHPTSGAEVGEVVTGLPTENAGGRIEKFVN